MGVLHVLNSLLWVTGNLALAYTTVALVLFISTYFIVFDPRATTGGRLIFQFMLSLAGVFTLVFIGIFVDPVVGRSWTVLPSDLLWWEPLVRFIVSGFTAYSITSLAVLLVLRRWFPHKLKKASDFSLVQPRRTSEIPVVKHLTPRVGSLGPDEDSGDSGV